MVFMAAIDDRRGERCRPIAGGWVFAQMCDLHRRDSAKFGVTQPKVGRGVAWSPPIVHMLGSRIAPDLMLTGGTIDAQRAYEIGFVNRVVPRAELIDAALAMAADIIECAPLYVSEDVKKRSRLQGETQAAMEREIVIAGGVDGGDAIWVADFTMSRQIV